MRQIDPTEQLLHFQALATARGVKLEEAEARIWVLEQELESRDEEIENLMVENLAFRHRAATGEDIPDEWELTDRQAQDRYN